MVLPIYLRYQCCLSRALTSCFVRRVDYFGAVGFCGFLFQACLAIHVLRTRDGATTYCAAVLPDDNTPIRNKE